MHILAFSDLHLDEAAADAILAEAGKADLVIGAGDFAVQRKGLTDFMPRFEPIARKAVFVPGNGESFEELCAATSALVLHGDAVVRGGLTIAGIGYSVPSLPQLPWASCDLDEVQAAALLDRIGAADILISHSPPVGIVDAHAEWGSIGSQAVLAAAKRLAPRLLFCGHVHDCWGLDGRIGPTRVRNLGPTPNWFEVES